MKRISVFFTELILIIVFGSISVRAQDTVYVPLKIRTGIEVSGPVRYFLFDKNILTTEGNLLVDISEKHSVMFGGGFADYKYSHDNYEYVANGTYLKAGMDFNLLGAKKAQGKFFTGIGIHYGIARFNSAVPLFRTENYFGPVESNIPNRRGIVNFAEAIPSVRAELFKNLSIGWNINIRVILRTSTGNDLKALYLPGFGNASKKVNTSLSYFITWNIPYRTKRVIILPPAPEEDEEVAPGVTP